MSPKYRAELPRTSVGGATVFLTSGFAREMMKRRCAMQVRTDRDAAHSTAAKGPVRRFFGTVADFFSPTLQCAACGAESKQRHCERTGDARPVATEASWLRATASEVEYVCPACGESIWVLEPSAYYYPMG